MTDGEQPLRCRGMRDLLPEEMVRYRQVEDTFARVCTDWGYSEIRTPTIEYLHLFTAAGTLSPQMLGRVYSFLDWDGWSGERVVLRPDATIPAARLYVENLRSGQIARFHYIQNVFRFSSGEESREDWQCGVELIGDLRREGDVELILLGRGVLESLDLRNVEVGLSHAGLVRAVLAEAGLRAEEQVAYYDRVLDGDLTVLKEIEARLPNLRAPLNLLFAREGGGASYVANLRGAFLNAVPGMAKPLDELTTISDTLDEVGCRYEVRTTLVRSFEYYTGPVFEFRVDGYRVGGGGRYDDLVALVGGEKVPASGFALDVSDVVSHLPTTLRTEANADRWLVRAASDAPQVLAGAFEAATRLREKGCRASMGGRSVKASGDRWELTVGRRKDRLTYRLRDLRTEKRTEHACMETVLAASGAARDD